VLSLLRNLNVNRDSTEDLVAAHAVADLVIGEFNKLGVTVPDWVEDTRRVVKRTLDLRLDEDRKKELVELSQALDKLSSPDEKKARLLARKAQLENQLNIPHQTQPEPAKV